MGQLLRKAVIFKGYSVLALSEIEQDQTQLLLSVLITGLQASINIHWCCSHIMEVFYNTSLLWTLQLVFIRYLFGRCKENVSFWGDYVDLRADDFVPSLLA